MDDVRKWLYYPIPMPVTADGKGPATVGVDAVRFEYEVWEAEPPHYSVASFDNLPDAINEAMRLNAALTRASDGRAEGLREAAEIVTKKCQKCGGEDWLWGHELDDPPDVAGHDDTRYSCDGEPHKLADAILARAAEIEGKANE